MGCWMKSSFTWSGCVCVKIWVKEWKKERAEDDYNCNNGDDSLSLLSIYFTWTFFHSPFPSLSFFPSLPSAYIQICYACYLKMCECVFFLVHSSFPLIFLLTLQKLTQINASDEVNLFFGWTLSLSFFTFFIIIIILETCSLKLWLHNTYFLYFSHPLSLLMIALLIITRRSSSFCTTITLRQILLSLLFSFSTLFQKPFVSTSLSVTICQL